MKARWRLALERLPRKLWFRAAVYACVGVLTALGGAIAKPLIASGVAGSIGADAVGNLLGILASSMLAVTTFSLSAMVSAYAAAGSSATPRTSTLLIEDAASQRALASFMGAFLFAIVGLIALSTGVYGDSGRVILFGATIVMIAIVVVTLLRWVDQLSRLGRVTETIDRAEQATRHTMQRLAQAPTLKARAALPELPQGLLPVYADAIGYATYIDVAALQAVAEKENVQFHVQAVAGHFVTPGQPLLLATRGIDGEARARLVNAFVIADMRDYEQDPRFGLIVLTEIALRALSPAVNDPGTAIDVIGTATRLLCGWADARAKADAVETTCDRVFVPAPDEADFFDDVFSPLARDAAGLLEVAIRPQKSLATLGGLGYPAFHAPARQHAQRALQLADAKLALPSDRARLHALAAWCDRI